MLVSSGVRLFPWNLIQAGDGAFPAQRKILFLELEVVKLGENGIDVNVGFRSGFFDVGHAKNTGFGCWLFRCLARCHFTGHQGLTTVFFDRRTILGGAVDF